MNHFRLLQGYVCRALSRLSQCAPFHPPAPSRGRADLRSSPCLLLFGCAQTGGRHRKKWNSPELSPAWLRSAAAAIMEADITFRSPRRRIINPEPSNPTIGRPPVHYCGVRPEKSARNPYVSCTFSSIFFAIDSSPSQFAAILVPGLLTGP